MLARLLYRLSARLPCRLIRRPARDGLDPPAGRPYLERYFLARLPPWLPLAGGGFLYLHRFLDSDDDAHGIHDHPWQRSLSLVLAGGYEEQRCRGDRPALMAEGHLPPLRRRWVGPGRLNAIGGRTWHRVIMPWDADCRLRSVPVARETWTLFWHGPFRKTWGFLAPAPESLGGLRWRQGTERPEGRDPLWWRNARAGRGAGREPLRGSASGRRQRPR